MELPAAANDAISLPGLCGHVIDVFQLLFPNVSDWRIERSSNGLQRSAEVGPARILAVTGDESAGARYADSADRFTAALSDVRSGRTVGRSGDICQSGSIYYKF